MIVVCCLETSRASTMSTPSKVILDAHGGDFRSKKNFVTAIYFHCGGLDLMPSTH
jgi:hypothetical protein